MTTLTDSTYRKYYEGTYLCSVEASVVSVGEDNAGKYAVLDQTIFHPQGGGQPNDQGFIKIGDLDLPVKKLAAPADPYEQPYVIKHYYDSIEVILNAGDKVTLTIDEAFRRKCARLHSAGHLLAHAVEKVYPQTKAFKGNHFPGQSFVVFKGTVDANRNLLKERAMSELNAFIQAELPVENDWSSSVRTVQFQGLDKTPCGGTHVENSKEIGEITIRSFKNEKGDLKIGYDVN